MAFILAWTTSPLNMLGSEFLFSSLDSEVLSFAPTALNLLTPGGNEQQFSGTFNYQIDPDTGEPDFIDGTITELAEFGPSQAHYWAKELTLPLTTWSQFLLANDAAGLQAYVLSGADRIIGSQQDDVLTGYDGDDVLDGSIGNDTIYGGTGNDLAFLRGLKSNWQIVRTDGKIVAADLTGNFGTDTLYDVEQLQFDDQLVTVNHAPTINQAGSLPRGTTSVVAASLFSAADADGDTITRYRLRDSDVGGGRFLLNGVAQPETVNFDVTAAQLAGLRLELGPSGYNNSFWVQAYDGYSWSNWSNIQLVSPLNSAPVVSVSDRVAPHGGVPIAASTLFSVSDNDGDPITQYRFFDGTVGSGYFRRSGNFQPEQLNFTIDAADLRDIDFVVGEGSDVLWIQAYDGMAWSAWKSFTLFPAPNNAPVVTINGASLNPARGTTVIAASNFFSVTDADNDTITKYRFYDGTLGAGRFELFGLLTTELGNITIDASDLSRFTYRTSSTGAGDTLWVQVYDGMNWSAWKSFAVSAPQNIAPAVTVNGGSLNPTRGTTTIAASSFFSVSDADGDAITQYRFFDGTAGNGHFELNGTPQTELVNLTVGAGDLASFQYRIGGTGDTLWVQAYDGTSWSAWKSFNVVAPANAAPAAAVADRTPARGTTTLAAAGLVSATDPDGDAITAYKFFDGTQGNGHFRKGGVDQAELVNINVSAAELGTTEFVLGGGSDVLWVQAFDGSTWSAWKSFTVFPPQNNAPVVTINGGSLNPARGTTTIAASAFFSVTDADNDTITQYRFFDGTSGNGHFELSGNAQSELVNLTVNAGDLANFAYRVGGTGDTLWVQAYDGITWSAWKSFNVAAPQNNAPVVTINQASLSPGHGAATVAASNFFSVSDADNDAITQFRFFDGNAGNGHFELNGNAQAELTNVTINASDLANFTYRTSTTQAGDTLWVQAFDGTAWSAWKSFNVAAPTNIAPTVLAEDWVYNDDPSMVDASALFMVSDPDDANMVRYHFYDSEINNGAFVLNGVTQQEHRNVTVEAADLANLHYIKIPGARETLWVQAFDGTAWSAWKTFQVTSSTFGLPPVITSGGTNISFNMPPVVSVTNTSAQAGTTVAISSLIGATDPEGDPVTAWRFVDTTAGHGSFRVGGVVQGDNQWIEVAANQLGSVDFLAGNTAGFNRLQVAAFDGGTWSDFKPFIINTLASS